MNGAALVLVSGLLAVASGPAAAAAAGAEGVTLGELRAGGAPPRKVAYKTAGEEALELDVYAPAGAARGVRLPAIVMIHGGGWANPGPFHFAPHCRYFASRGMVAVNVQYRLVTNDGRVRIADCVADCRDAFRYVLANAAELGVDAGRVAVAGDSAGGHLAAMLATAPTATAGGGERFPAAAILYNPCVDLAGLHWMKRHPGLTGEGDEAWKEDALRLSPVELVRAGLPPMLLIHGTQDATVPVEHADRFAGRLLGAGNRIEYHRMEGWKHAFVIPDYGPDEQIVESVRMTDRFLAGLGLLDGLPTIEAGAPAAP
jgi:acetyl esterase/lipase